MEVLRHPDSDDPRLARVALTLGNFDGVHLGHQAILQRTIDLARAERARAGLLTFQPHPASVLAPDKAPPLIVPLRGKLELLAASGIDFVWVAAFTRRFAELSPDTFVREFLMSRVGLAAMVVGYNVNFGKNRAGNASVLQQIGSRVGFDVEVVGPVTRQGVQVSSTAVRSVLGQGDVAAASALLGRPHMVWGRVGRGAHRGRELGFPTANLSSWRGLTPADGVYAVRVDALGQRYAGVANVGKRPTFGELTRNLEVHLFDFDQDLYRRAIRLDFMERLRGEEKFASAEALVRQIRQDVERARTVLASIPERHRTGSEP